MGQKKLLRFEAIGHFRNVLQYPEGMPGKWNEFFQNTNPLTLELACGKGEYTVGLAALYPERNVIGVDLKGNRIYAGAKQALEKNLHNAAFLRTHIDKIHTYFAPGEVSEIWITFPDPQLRTSRAKKRLTHPRFLRLYQQILHPDGIVHLKTDSPNLFYFTRFIADLYSLKILDETEDLYGRENSSPEIEIKTHYEMLDIANSKKIFYLKFMLSGAEIPPPGKDLQEVLKQIENQEAPHEH